MKVTIFTILFFFYLGFASENFACGCLQSNISLREIIEKTSVVFLGKVIKVSVITRTPDILGDRPSKYYKYTFEVIKNYKSKKSVFYFDIISQDYGGNSCGFECVLNKKYIVYADSINNSGEIEDTILKPYLYTSKCKKTSEYTPAKNRLIIKALRKKG